MRFRHRKQNTFYHQARRLIPPGFFYVLMLFKHQQASGNLKLQIQLSEGQINEEIQMAHGY